ncbi:MAG: tetratricopeptide repeat protein [Methylococcales bacterium]|jgi:tetratricopeptide (TPR) repeat protein|nr:tetratricopeptide repeat protein [Methylococcales bacterium]
MIKQRIIFSIIISCLLNNFALASGQAEKLPVLASSNEVKKQDISTENQLTQPLLYSILVGEIAWQNGHISLASDAYAKAAQYSNNLDIVKIASKLAVLANNYENVIQFTENWLDKEPDDSHALQMQALGYLRSKQLSKSAASFVKYLKLKKSADLDNSIQLVVALLGQEKETDNAFKVMQQIYPEMNENAVAAFGYASLALRANQINEAELYSRKAIELKPTWSKAIVLSAHILLKKDSTKEAIKLLQSALERDATLYLPRVSLARIFLEQRDFDQAKKHFLIVLKQKPYNTEIWYALALLSLQAKELEESKDYFERLYELNSRQSESAYYLGQIEESLKNIEKSIEWYERVTSDEYYLESRLRVIGLIALNNGFKAIGNRLDELRWKFPDSAIRFYLIEGELLSQDGRDKDAMAIYSKALKEHVENTKLLYARGLLGQSMGMVDILENDLKIVIRKEPENADALNALGYTLADQTNRYEEALKLINRAYALKPELPAVIDSKGWVEYRLGNLEEAKTHLEKAYKLYKDAEIAAHLGEVLWVIGAQEKAGKIWSDALKNDTKNTYLLKTIDKFKHKN